MRWALIALALIGFSTLVGIPVANVSPETLIFPHDAWLNKANNKR